MIPLTPLKKAAITAEYKVILEVLEKTKFNKSKAAEILQIDRGSITNKVNLYNRMLAEEKLQTNNKPVSTTH